MKYLKNISNFGKKFLIKENKQQAESILSKLGLDFDNSDYKEIRDLVGNNNNYLGLFTKFFFTQNASIIDLEKIITFLRSEDVKKLNENPLKYDFEKLDDEITEIETDKQVMSFYNELTTDQKEFVDIENEDFRSFAEQFFTIKSKRGFFKNVSKIKNFRGLLSSMKEYIEKYNKYGSYKNVIKILNENPSFYDIVSSDDEKELIIAKIKNYEGSKLIGSENWCIVNSASHWVNYTSSTPRNQYFVWNFSLELSDANYYTAYTVNIDDTFHASFDFNNKSLWSKLPQHVRDNKEFLKGPSKSDLNEIQLRKVEEEETRKREQRERQLRILREKQARAEIHRGEELFETYEPARAMIEFLKDEQGLELDEDEDIYDVVFHEEWTHYDLEVYVNDNDQTEWCIGTYKQSHDSCYEYLDNYIDETGYSFNLDMSSYIDEKALGSYIASWDEDHIREEWKDYDIEPELTSRSEDKLEEVIEFIKDNSKDKEQIVELSDKYFEEKDKLDFDDIESILSDLEDMLSDLEEPDNFNTEDEDELSDLEEERSEFYDFCREAQDKDDDDHWEMSEDAYDTYISNREKEIQDDPLDHLRNYFGYDESELKQYIEDYIDKDELIDDIIRMDGFGHTLNNYDGEQHEVEFDGTDYYIFQIG